MQIAVYDTYVRRNDGLLMHFDILVPATLNDPEAVLGYGRTYLAGKGIAEDRLTTRECRFCHFESAPGELQEIISRDGYSILEMENCG
jgi:hypothetical protein